VKSLNVPVVSLQFIPLLIERLYQTVAKNIENVVSEAIEKALAGKVYSKNIEKG